MSFFFNKRAILWLFFWCCLMTASAFAQVDPELGKIAAVKIEGNKNVSTLVIFGHLVEKEGDLFSLRRARMDIHNLFATGSFKNVKVTVTPADKLGEIVVTFTVEERPLISKIIFAGNKKWDSKKFLEEIKTAPETAFDQSKVNGDIEIIKKLYLDEGYSSVMVSAKDQLDPETNKETLTFQITEGSEIKVGGVIVKGAEVFSGKKVANQMKDNHEGDKYKPDLIADGIKQIEDFYHNEGYLKAVVLSHAEKVVEERKKVYIFLTVKEGSQYTMGTAQFHGNVVFDDDDLNKALGLKKGDILHKNDLDDGEKKMKTLYADKGYIYSNIVPTITYDDELKKTDITFEITEGQVAYVQDVKIVGNYKTRDYVIRRELVINAGDKFEADKIRLSAQNLYNLGFFDEVNPEVEPGDTPGKEVLIFRVKERRTGSISLGGGYSSVDGFVGNVKLSEDNLFGKGQRASLNVQFGGSQTSFDIGFTEPWLFNTRTSFGLDVFYTTQIYTNAVADPTYGSTQFYTEERLGGTITVGRRLDRYWSIFGAYLLERVRIYDVGPYYNIPGTAQYIQSSNSTTSSITPRIVYDSRDNYFDPTSGWKHQFSIEFAGGPLGMDTNFIKEIEDTSHFIALPQGFVLGEHVRFGAAQGYWFAGRGYTDVPIYEKFYAGGTDTIRGYNERSVGPVAGGNALFVSNTELKHAIAGPLRFVVFFDAGDSWSNVWNLDESQVQFGSGLGFRLTIPGTVMAIRLDYGWPVASHLSAAAAPPGGVLHFNLGDLF